MATKESELSPTLDNKIANAFRCRVFIPVEFDSRMFLCGEGLEVDDEGKMKLYEKGKKGKFFPADEDADPADLFKCFIIPAHQGPYIKEIMTGYTVSEPFLPEGSSIKDVIGEDPVEEVKKKSSKKGE